MNLTKPDRRMIGMILGVVVLAVLALTETIDGNLAYGAIIGILASMGVYQAQ